MIFNEEEQKKISSLPIVLRTAVEMLIGVIKKILNDECDPDELVDTMSTINANASGRYANSDLVNYDEAARIIGVSVTNRTKLKTILDAHGIKQVVMHNQKIGFRRSEIEALRTKMTNKRKKT